MGGGGGGEGIVEGIGVSVVVVEVGEEVGVIGDEVIS